MSLEISGVPSVAESLAKAIVVPSKTIYHILGISGYKQSGKNTAATLIQNSFSVQSFSSIKQLAFADEIKREVTSELGITIEKLESIKNTVAMRRLLQYWGTEYGRDTLGEDVWINKLHKHIMERVLRLPSGKNILFIITDVRFPNEAAYIKEQGGCIIRVERRDSKMGNVDTHRSESSIENIHADWTIPNHGKIRDLRRECLWIMQFLKEKWKID